jgi:hypothetical protein
LAPSSGKGKSSLTFRRRFTLINADRKIGVEDEIMDRIAAAEWIWLGFITAFGACVGSFLNVVIYRLPREKSLVWPGSACPSCGTAIRFYDNIPLASWLLLRGPLSSVQDLYLCTLF